MTYKEYWCCNSQRIIPAHDFLGAGVVSSLDSVGFLAFKKRSLTITGFFWALAFRSSLEASSAAAPLLPPWTTFAAFAAFGAFFAVPVDGDGASVIVCTLDSGPFWTMSF